MFGASIEGNYATAGCAMETESRFGRDGALRRPVTCGDTRARRTPQRGVPTRFVSAARPEFCIWPPWFLVPKLHLGTAAVLEAALPLAQRLTCQRPREAERAAIYLGDPN